MGFECYAGAEHLVKYLKESFDDVVIDIFPLLNKHWEEIALNKDKVPLDPNLEKYKTLEQSGILDIFTARDDSNKLVGYCIVFTMPHMHYWSTLMSSVDIFYVSPEHRGKMTGSRLMTYAEKELKASGTKVLTHHVKVAHDYSPILVRKGYKEAERIFSKYIGE